VKAAGEALLGAGGLDGGCGRAHSGTTSFNF